MAQRGLRAGGRGSGGWLPAAGPQRWVSRRRRLIALLLAAMVGAAAYDHLRRPGRPGPAPAALPGDDIAVYDGKAFRVVAVVDGDTLHIDVPGSGKGFAVIRLWGVDTPEVHGLERPDYFGPEASRFTRSLADGQPVRLELVPGRTRDRYGRLLAYVYLPDGTMLNERLVAEGYGYADTRFPHRLRAGFVRLEQQARRARAGLWGGVTPADMPAWRQSRERPAEAPEPGV